MVLFLLAVVLVGCSPKEPPKAPGEYVGENARLMSELGNKDVILRVNGHDFTKADFLVAVSMQDKIRRMCAGDPLTGENKPAEEYSRWARPRTLSEILRHALVRQYAEKNNITATKEELDVPICYNYSAEKDARVQWPFGYGLSYTTFEYQNLKADAEVETSAESVNMTFEVKNTGKMAADEIVQIYLSPTSASQQIRPIQLQGFARVTLKPGETKTVQAKLYTDQFGYYSHKDQRQWNIAPGQFVVKIGASSEDIRLHQTVTLKGEAVTKPLRDHYFSETTTL